MWEHRDNQLFLCKAQFKSFWRLWGSFSAIWVVLRLSPWPHGNNLPSWRLTAHLAAQLPTGPSQKRHNTLATRKHTHEGGADLKDNEVPGAHAYQRLEFIFQKREVWEGHSHRPPGWAARALLPTLLPPCRGGTRSTEEKWEARGWQPVSQAWRFTKLGFVSPGVCTVRCF